ncbi:MULTISPECIES: transglutaminase domain-containing protein [unclassified Exiguobacterium]|uniref:transglutaminase domain-containing protein n=1 Tax=unclassified Exiguobacterium TaxID=2644629 RepID=UPI001BE75BF9|nr:MULTISPECIES: transglutaminase domain-containing protein [unclassified Exiguobacterium]
MSPIIIGAIVLLICLPLSYLLGKRAFQLFRIHIRLRAGLFSVRHALRAAKHHPGRQFDILDPIYRGVVFQLNGRNLMKRTELEQAVNDELNRVLKYGWLSSLALVGRGILAMIFLVIAGVSGNVVAKDAKSLDMASWFEPQHVESETTVLGKTFKLPYEINSAETLGTAIAYHMTRFDETFSIPYTGDTGDMQQTMDDAWDWIERHHIYVYRLSRGGESKWVEQNGKFDLQMTLNYDMTASEAAQVQERVNEVIRDMPRDLDEVGKVKYVNDYVVSHTAYNLDSQASPYTPYSILFNGEGVCEGYALTTLLLLEAAGIEARYISGEVASGLHAWNLVRVNNEWYHLDTTWNDPVPNQPGNGRTDYFLVSDATLRADHTWAFGQYPVTATQNIQL